MPVSLELPLDRRLAKRLPPNAVPALHANFFRWLEASDQALARALDASQGIKPFTTSPLFVTREWASFRITLLQESLLERLEHGIRARPVVDVLGQILPILVGDLSIVVADYELMLTNATTETRQAVLEFRTPMSCRSDGMDYPLPDPELVFDSYRKRWNTFAPQHLFISESWLDWLRASVAVSRFDLKTEPIRFPDGLQIGCVGRVRYLVLESGLADREAVAVFNCLADYAFFCGTGRKTTQGMGQTTRLAHD